MQPRHCLALPQRAAGCAGIIVMSATIIPFPRAKEPLGSPEHELAKLAAMIHAKAIKNGKASSYESCLQVCEKVAAEVFAKEFNRT